MTPAMRADAADALMRLEMKELAEKLNILAGDSRDPTIERTALKMIRRYFDRFELMAKEIEEQMAEAKASTNGR